VLLLEQAVDTLTAIAGRSVKDASFCECGGECCHSNVECGLVDAQLLAPLAPRRLPFLAIATNVGCLRETRT
jgi:hypothetical protein